MDLARSVYQLTKFFPKEELFSLTPQMRRAAVSIPSNIAEGRRRGTSKDFKQFLSIAHGSLAETETQLELATDLGYVSPSQTFAARTLADEVNRMLTSLRSTA